MAMQSVMTEAMPDDGFNAQITVRLSDDSFGLGDKLYFDVELKNSSKYPWPAEGPKPVRLSYHWLDQQGKILIFDGDRTLLPCDLKAGQIVVLHAAVRLPRELGFYILEFDLVQEFVAWFKDKGSQTVHQNVSIAGDLPQFDDYHAVWKKADLDKDHWSVVGPASQDEFKEAGRRKLQFLVDLGLRQNSSVLDVGCGTGCLTQAIAAFLNDEGKYSGTDLAQEAVVFCKSRFKQANFNFVQNEMTFIPIFDAKFDFIVFSSIFTHTFLHETAILLKEARRLVSDNGVVLADVFFGSQRSSLANDRALVAISPTLFLETVRQAGFTADAITESIWKFGNQIFVRTAFRLTPVRQ